MKQSGTSLLSVSILLCILTKSNAHGLISWPRQRGLLGQNNRGLPIITADAPADFCPHCLNGGGTGTIKKHIPDGRWTPYEPTNPSFRFRDDHGICGDPRGNNDHMLGGQYYAGVTIATYEEGDYLDAEAHVSAHHNGYFEFFACSLDCCGEKDLSKNCFAKKCCQKMVRVPHQSCEAGLDRICGPVDPLHPGRWYLPPRDERTPGDNWYGGLNKKMRYALPTGMTCERCVVHWGWTTANSCNPPGYAEYNFPKKWEGIPGDGGSVGGINRGFGTCGDDGESFPEEFWSCSENVRIVKKNGGKDRTSQMFHNGDMNIEGPGASNSSQKLEPMKEPVTVPVTEQPAEENPPPSTATPSTDTGLKSATEELHKEIEKYGNSTAGSSYNLSLYVNSYDTGTCVARDTNQYCQACLDLGYGATKCFWCTKDGSGNDNNCLHEKP